MRTKCYAILIVLISLTSYNIKAANYSIYSYLPRASFSVGKTFELKDALSHSETLNGTDIYANRTHNVRLVYDRTLHTDLEGTAFSLKVEYDVIFTNGDGSTAVENGVLSISFGNGNTVLESVNSIPNAGPNSKVQITGICYKTGIGSYNCGGTLPNYIPQDIKLVAEYKVERYVEMREFTDLYNSDATVMRVKYPNDEIALSWKFIEGAESYDVEWMFIDETDDVYSSYANAASVNNNPFEKEPVDNFRQPVRINTTDQHYTLENTFNKGILFFRVRGVGRFVRQTDGVYDYARYGRWNYYLTDDYGAGELNSVVTIQFQQDKTWQMQKTYVEDGKNKKVITYYDETNRGRQILTNVSSNNTTVIAETKYDYEGRPVVNILPTPVPGSNIAYRYYFNAISSGNPFSKEEFDRGIQPAPILSNISGAGNYYSSASAMNAIANINQGYTPSANGYAYTQVKYLRDNTGRVERQSGVSEKHKLYGGSDTRYYYGRANETELERLFGSNVGIALHYEKVAIQDPNGQMSVAYKDQEGRVIATALVGQSPDNVMPLDYNQPASIQLDLTENNYFDAQTNTFRLDYEILNTKEGDEYKFYYDLKPFVKDGDVCHKCTYKLKITVLDPDGYPVTLTKYTSFPSSFPATANFSSHVNFATPGVVTDLYEPPLCTVEVDNLGYANNLIDSKNIGFYSTFSKIGSYKIIKELTLVLPKVDDDLIADWVSTGKIPSRAQIEQNELNSVKIEICDVTCADKCKTLHPGTDGASISAYNACMVQCNDRVPNYTDSIALDECDGLRAQMLAQLSPGGLYYDVWVTNWSNQTSIDAFRNAHQDEADLTNSYIQSNLNPLGHAEQPAQDDIHVYYDAPNTTSPVSISDLKNPDLFMADWAEQLLELHPEYCHLALCGNPEASRGLYQSRKFDAEMALISNWYDASTKYGNPPHPENSDLIFDAYDPAHVGDGKCEINPGGCSFTRQHLIDRLTNAGGNSGIKFSVNVSGSYVYRYTDIFSYVDPDFDIETGSIGFHVNKLYSDIDPSDWTAIQIRKWQLFRGKYLDFKREEIRQNLVECYCNSSNSNTYDIPALTSGYLLDGNGEKLPWAVVEPIRYADATINQIVSSANTSSPANITNYQTAVSVEAMKEECKTTCDELAEKWYNDLYLASKTPPKKEPGTITLNTCRLSIQTAIMDIFSPGNPPAPNTNIPIIKSQFKSFCEAKCDAITTSNSVVVPPVITNEDLDASGTFPKLESLNLIGCVKPNDNCEDRLAYWLEQMIGNCPSLMNDVDKYVSAHGNTISVASTNYTVQNDIAALSQCLYIICNNASNIFNDNFMLDEELVTRMLLSGNPALHDAMETVQDIIQEHGCGKVSSVVTEGFDRSCSPSACLKNIIYGINYTISNDVTLYDTIYRVNDFDTYTGTECNATFDRPTVEVIVDYNDGTTEGSEPGNPNAGGTGTPTTTPVVTVTWTTNVALYPSVSATTFTNDGITTIIKNYSTSSRRSGTSDEVEYDTIYSNPRNKRSRHKTVITMPSTCNLLSFYDACGNVIYMEDIVSIGDPYFADVPPNGLGLVLGGSGMQFVQVAAVIHLEENPSHTYCQTGTNEVIAYFYKPRNSDCPFEYVTCNEPTIQDWKDDCIDFLYREALHNAEVKWNKLIDEYTTQYYNQYLEACKKSKERLKIEYLNNEYHYTLYYYDQAGNLVQTVPPEGVDVLGIQNWSDDESSTDELLSLSHLVNDVGIVPADQPNHRLITRYQYNALNQVIWQSTPDGGESHFWYNQKGQLKLSQNAKQLANNRYSFTNYDNLGRIVTVGEVSGAGGVIPGTDVDDPTFPQTNVGSSAPDALYDLTVTTYDAPSGSTCIGAQTYLRGRVSSVSTYNGVNAGGNSSALSSSQTSSTVYSYDIHGNVDKLSQNIIGMDLDGDGSDDCKKVNYKYDLLSGKVNQVIYQQGASDMFMHKYEYDADNRLTNVYTSRDNLIWDEDANYFYYPHGPLARTEIGEDQIQAMDYYYTVHGWLKGVNMPNSDDALGRDGIASTINANRYFAKDEYKFAMGYYDGDYSPTGTAATSPLSAASSPTAIWNGIGSQNGLYNGNIAWIIGDIPDMNRQYGDQPTMQAMAYKYDQLNRIKMSGAFTYSSSNWVIRPDGNYATLYSFDKNGNITSLMREAGGDNMMDNLTYKYNIAHNNRLVHVNDAANSSLFNVDVDDQGSYSVNINTGVASGNYGYDEIGNLVRDDAEKLAEIKWNVYGKIGQILPEIGSGKPWLEFAYDGTGNRIRKTVTPEWINNEAEITQTYYVRDASGNVMATYTKSAVPVPHPGGTTTYLPTLATEYPIYGSSRLGIYETSTGGIQAAPELSGELGQVYRKLGRKQYELTDHLGNVTVTVSDIKRGIASGNSTFHHYEASVTSFNDYYPYGMVMPGRSYSSPSYRYGYNGKEKDDEVKGGGNCIGWAERMYDTRLGRWVGIDGASYYYPAVSPYTYCANSPLYIQELDGNFIGTISGYVIGGSISLGKALYDGKSGMDLGKAWVRGSTTGMVAGAIADITIATCGTGTLAVVAAGSLSGIGGNLTNQAIQHYDWGKKYDPGETIRAGVIGGVLGWVAPKVINWAAPKVSVAITRYFGKTPRGKTASIEIELPEVTQFGTGPLKTPLGLNSAEFSSVSQTVRQATNGLSNDIVVQGSRANGTATAASDLDIAIKVPEEQFNALVKKFFNNPNIGSAKERTMMHALQTGKIQAGEAGLTPLRKVLEKALKIPVDVSIIKIGGAFDNGTQIPLK